jgi:hypothetical protein
METQLLFNVERDESIVLKNINSFPPALPSLTIGQMNQPVVKIPSCIEYWTGEAAIETELSSVSSDGSPIHNKNKIEQIWDRLIERREARSIQKYQEEQSVLQMMVDMEDRWMKTEEEHWLQLEEERLQIEAQKVENDRQMFEFLLRLNNNNNHNNNSASNYYTT